ncbi:MAG: hypothetical protein ACFE0J_16115 [Elainellaceae cyanobacterium]
METFLFKADDSLEGVVREEECLAAPDREIQNKMSRLRTGRSSIAITAICLTPIA